jgi:Arc/MetJ-type ribon-helix-helix transcriptional regulator
MTIELKPEQERMIDLAIQSGAYHNSDEVIATALSMLAEDIEDGAVSEARSHEPRSTLAEVEAELRELGKVKNGIPRHFRGVRQKRA